MLVMGGQLDQHGLKGIDFTLRVRLVRWEGIVFQGYSARISKPLMDIEIDHLLGIFELLGKRTGYGFKPLQICAVEVGVVVSWSMYDGWRDKCNQFRAIQLFACEFE